MNNRLILFTLTGDELEVEYISEYGYILRIRKTKFDEPRWFRAKNIKNGEDLQPFSTLASALEYAYLHTSEIY